MSFEVIGISQAPRDWETHSGYVYIGRRGRGFEGYFGNPVVRGKECPVCKEDGQPRVFHQDDGATLPCYKKHLWKMMHRPEFRKRLAALDGKTGVCFCKSKEQPNAPCHGDVMKDAIKWLKSQENVSDE